MKRWIVASVLSFLLLGGAVAAWATASPTPRYYAVDLGAGWGYAMNEAGLVAGFATGADGTSHAVVWDSATGERTDLGIAYSAATGINDDGVVAGYAVSGGLQHAFRWQNGVRTDLGALPGDTQSAATGINASGQIAGWSGGPSGTRAFVWTDGTMTDLGNLGGSSTIPNAINDAGEVVGSARPTGDPSPHDFPVTHAFRWDAVTAIGDLDDGRGNLGSEALGMNESGDVVGVSWSWCDCGYYEATGMLWRNGTGTPVDDFANFAVAVNDATEEHGVQIVGTVTAISVIWELDAAGGITAAILDDVVDISGGPWDLTWPRAINDRGQILCGDWGGHVTVLTPGSRPAPPPPPPPPPPSKPPAPASLAAQAGTEKVTLSWSSVSMADSYAVKRGTASGGPYATIATLPPASSSYIDTTAPLGSTSFYVVTASNAGGEGPPSPVASAAPLPYPPTNLTATAGTRNQKSQINVRWTASTSKNIAQYRVYRRDPTGDVLIATVVPSTSFTVTALSRRTTYTFVMTALLAGGQESVASNDVSVTTQ